MLIVCPFNSKDADLMRRNLAWCLELDSGCGRHGVLAYDKSVAPDLLAQISILAQQYFTHVHHCQYEEPPVKGWPAAPNWAWQSTARWMFASPMHQPWFWLEADAIPIQSGWFIKLEESHTNGGKSFGGHVVKDMGHMNGVGIYPWDVLRRNEMAMLARAAAWDVVLKPSIVNDITPLNSLIQHAWNVHPTDRTMIWNGDGMPVSFKSQADVELYLDFNAVIIHRCKDGSLIPWLKERLDKQRLIMSTEYNVPQHVKYEEKTEYSPSVENGTLHSVAATPSGGSETTSGHSDAANDIGLLEGAKEQGGVAQVATRKTEILNEEAKPEEAKPTLGQQPVSDTSGPGPQSEVDKDIQAVRNDPIPKTEIFIVTYGQPTKRPSNLIVSDFDWLTWCLRGIRRHCTGFTGITLAIPDRDAEMLKSIANEHAQAKSGIPLRIKMFTEPPGKGHIAHMAIMGMADEQVPKDTEFVLHVDADVIFKEPVTPLDYIQNGKPVYVWRTYESLSEMRNGQQVVSDCIQWRAPTEAQLGFPVEAYTMCRHPSCFPISFYKPYRQNIEVLHGKPYWDYMVSGRNEFPASRMDFTAMGAFAFKTRHEQFEWVDVSNGNHLAPRDKQKCYWSHHGVAPVEAEIRELLK